MMGINDAGQLGSKSCEMQKVPSRVCALDVYRITHIAIGFSHVLAITEMVRS